MDSTFDGHDSAGGEEAFFKMILETTRSGAHDHQREGKKLRFTAI